MCLELGVQTVEFSTFRSYGEIVCCLRNLIYQSCNLFHLVVHNVKHNTSAFCCSSYVRLSERTDELLLVITSGKRELALGKAKFQVHGPSCTWHRSTTDGWRTGRSIELLHTYEWEYEVPCFMVEY